MTNKIEPIMQQEKNKVLIVKYGKIGSSWSQFKEKL